MTEKNNNPFNNDIDEVKENENVDKEILETKNESTPIVPVYEAEIPQEDLVMSDPVEQGDVVVHSKYGSGVVEKMIKYRQFIVQTICGAKYVRLFCAGSKIEQVIFTVQ